jgi:BirA family biotin operon repressor/biotin-[acetyl-CoA-carboxylase] ligase
VIPAVATEQTRVCHGWTLHELAVTDSTNLAAAEFPAWHAVRSDRQNAGRGRFQRGWVSDEGGLWMSAVVPTGPSSSDWQALPLAVGLAVCRALGGLGVQPLRLRWPNDVLVRDRKLAGLLVEQFIPGLAVAGLGINVANHPELCDPALQGLTTRLADLLPAPPSLADLAALVLREMRAVVEQMDARGFAPLVPALNRLWAGPRRVELDLDGKLQSGVFTGVGAGGELQLTDDAGHQLSYQSHQVRHLKEI